jgi:chemotaxis protein histidine kinase CheA
MGDGRVALILDVDVMVMQSNAAAPAPPDGKLHSERTLAEVS